MHTFPFPARRATSLILATVATFGCLQAQNAPLVGHWEQVQVHSGTHDNPAPVEAVVWSHFVMLPQGTPWQRLYFDAANLDKGSYLRMTALVDGSLMTMRQEHLPQWGYSSCYFNGSTVLVELVAGPNTVGNFVDITRVMAGDQDPVAQVPETICGTQDNRVPSSDARTGRIDPIGCTGWIINAPSGGNDKAHLSAGHCFGTGQVLSFDVPNSNANCSLNFPPAAKQFAIDSAGSQSANTGIGNDWWVFRCFPNSTTGLTTFQEQIAAFNLAAALPANNTTLRNYGFGLDGTNTNNATGGNASCTCTPANGTGTRNQIQQTDTGPLVSVSGNRLNYSFDTCGGNSGSPVINESTGQAIGIHTNGGCTTTAGSTNSGTSILNANLQAAITNVQPPVVSNDFCINAIDVGIGVNGPFSNVGSTLSPNAWGCGFNVGRDVWFRLATTCAGSYTISTCTPTRNFDTVIQVFASCGGTAIACNDDSCGLGSRLVVNLPSGTHFIRVGGYNQQSGNFDVVVEQSETYDAGPLITDATGGAGGAPISALQSAPPFNLGTFGYTANSSFNLADDFVTNGPWCVRAIELFVYQTGVTAPSINGVFLEIYNGNPTAGGVPIAGSPGFANNLVTTSGYTVTNTMTNTYRVLQTTPGDTNRRIQSVLVGLPAGLNLNSASIPGGRYWLRMAFTGTSPSGPFVPPITVWNSPATGNAIQNTVSSGTWGPVLNNNNGQGLPFKLYGTSSSLPGAFIALGGGCSPATLELRGAPHVGGVMHAEIVNANPAAIPLIILGFNDPNAPFAPFCGCVQRASLDVLNVGTTYNWQIPTLAAAVGFQMQVQGDLLFAPGLACDIGVGFRFELTNAFRMRLY